LSRHSFLGRKGNDPAALTTMTTPDVTLSTSALQLLAEHATSLLVYYLRDDVFRMVSLTNLPNGSVQVKCHSEKRFGEADRHSTTEVDKVLGTLFMKPAANTFTVTKAQARKVLNTIVLRRLASPDMKAPIHTDNRHVFVLANSPKSSSSGDDAAGDSDTDGGDKTFEVYRTRTSGAFDPPSVLQSNAGITGPMLLVSTFFEYHSGHKSLGPTKAFRYQLNDERKFDKHAAIKKASDESLTTPVLVEAPLRALTVACLGTFAIRQPEVLAVRGSDREKVRVFITLQSMQPPIPASRLDLGTTDMGLNDQVWVVRLNSKQKKKWMMYSAGAQAGALKRLSSKKKIAAPKTPKSPRSSQLSRAITLF